MHTLRGFVRISNQKNSLNKHVFRVKFRPNTGSRFYQELKIGKDGEPCIVKDNGCKNS